MTLIRCIEWIILKTVTGYRKEDLGCDEKSERALPQQNLSLQHWVLQPAGVFWKAGA